MEVMCPMGEFQKHLHYTSTEAQRRIYEQGIDLDLQLEKIVMVWVKEAKKEFQANIIHGHYKEDGSLCKHAPYIHPNKAIEWFDKWFGKANAKGK